MLETMFVVETDFSNNCTVEKNSAYIAHSYSTDQKRQKIGFRMYMFVPNIPSGTFRTPGFYALIASANVRLTKHAGIV